MRILLIFPPDCKVLEPFRSAPKPPPPLLWGFPIGLGYLASFLEKSGHKVAILDCLRQDRPFDNIQKEIKKFKPDLVGITVMTVLARTADAIAHSVKEINKDISIVGGGPHATFDYKNLLTNYDFDYIVLGEGENTLSELVNCLDNNKKNEIRKILGLVYKTNDKIIVNDPRPLINNIDELPYPARHLLNLKDYISDGLLPKAVEIMGSRGCSHRCIFCSSSHLFGRWRARSPKNVIKEMKSLIRKNPEIKSFYFYDDNFTLNKARVIEFCQLLISEGLNGYYWDCLGRADQVNEEMLRLMKKAGCKKISYGIESGSQEIIKNINKNLNLEVAKETIKITRSIGIEALAFMMIGNPGETTKTIQQSIDFIKEVKPTSTLWSIAQIYPGTEMERLQPVEDFTKFIYEPEVKNPFPFTHPLIPTFDNKGLKREKLKLIYRQIFRYFTFFHLLNDPIGRFKHFLVSPRNATIFLVNLLKK